MGILPYSEESEAHYARRLSNVMVDSERRFGSMDTTRMLRHMRKSFESASGVGIEDVKDISTPVFREVVFFIVTRVVKVWPGGKFKAPGYWSPPAEGDFEDELRLFREAAVYFLGMLESDADARFVHPLFGPLSVRQWGLLLGPHLHHHLRQFGV